MFGALILTMMLAGSAAGEQGAPLPTQAEAEALAQQGNREAALAAFQRRAAANPADLTARLWIARLHTQMGRPDLAESVYRAVMLEAPDNVEAMTGVGTTLVSMQRGDEALLILDRTAKLEPKNAAVLAASAPRTCRLTTSSSGSRTWSRPHQSPPNTNWRSKRPAVSTATRWTHPGSSKTSIRTCRTRQTPT